MKTHWKIFFALSLFIALSDILFLWLNYRRSNVELSRSLYQTDAKIFSSFQLALDNTETQMLQLATYVGENEQIQQLFLAGKKAVEAEGGLGGGERAAEIRRELYSLVEEPRKKLAESYDFRQLHFHLGPGALSFLRAHKPAEFGDQLDTIRHTIVSVNTQQQPVSGFESGRIYSGIRGVVPIFAWDNALGKKVYVGALEAGTSFQTTLSAVAKNQETNIGVALDMEYLQARSWPKFLQKSLEANPPVNGYMIESTTNPHIATILQRFDQESADVQNKAFIHVIDEIPYAVSFFPFRDFHGTRDPSLPDVGRVVFWRNIQMELASFYHSILITVYYGFFGFFLLECLLFFAIRTSTKKLEENIAEKQETIRQALLESRASRERFQTVADYAYDWEIWTLPDGRQEYMSPSCERITGYTVQEFMDDPDLRTRIVHPDDREEHTAHRQLHLQEESEHSFIEFRIIHKKGHIVWIWHECLPVWNEEHKWLGRRISNRDITDKKQIELKLQAAKETAEKASEAKSMFFTNTSHELRTPLNAILGYTQIFLQDSSLSARHLDGIRTIHQGAEHLLLMINDILDLSRIESDKMDLFPTEVSTRAFLQSVANIIGIKASEKQLAFHLLPAPDLPAIIECDEQRLRQILLNLLANAVKFTDRGWVRLSVTSETVAGKKERARLSFVVEDTGTGIPDPMQEAIFQPFRQVGNRLHSAEGSGLGLTISRELVKIMGGELQVQSPLAPEKSDAPGGPGSRFMFHFEVTVIQGEGAASELASSKNQFTIDPVSEFQKKKILLVDDEASNLIMLQSCLVPYGFILNDACNGREAIEKSADFQPDLILMDLLMPEVDGYEAARHIREHGECATVPIIAVSAAVDSDGTIEQQCIEAGFNEYLSKPLSIEELHYLLERYLLPEQKDSEQENSGILFPGLEILLPLYEKAQIGDVISIREMIAQLSNSDKSPRYGLFIRKVTELTESFHFEILENFLKEELEKNP